MCFLCVYMILQMAKYWNISHETYVLLSHHFLTVGEEYQARVRVKPAEPINDGYFQGEWSHWSPAVSWRSDIGKPLVKPGDEESSPGGASCQPSNIL